MEKISVRLAPEVSKKLQAEARKMEQATGKTVTVSDLIRACISEKFPQISARITSEAVAISEQREEVAGLRQDVQNLVNTLADTLPLLAKAEQIGTLTESIETVIRAVRGR